MNIDLAKIDNSLCVQLLFLSVMIKMYMIFVDF